MRSACYIEVPALNVNANCNLRVYQFLHEWGNKLRRAHSYSKFSLLLQEAYRVMVEKWEWDQMRVLLPREPNNSHYDNQYSWWGVII